MLRTALVLKCKTGEKYPLVFINKYPRRPRPRRSIPPWPLSLNTHFSWREAPPRPRVRALRHGARAMPGEAGECSNMKRRKYGNDQEFKPLYTARVASKQNNDDHAPPCQFLPLPVGCVVVHRRRHRQRSVRNGDVQLHAEWGPCSQRRPSKGRLGLRGSSSTCRW